MDFSKLSDFGNFIITGISGVSLTDSDKQILQEIRPAGVLFLKRNLRQDCEYEKWHEEFAKLIADIKKYSGRDKILLTIDHEGGQVQRTPPPITNFGRPEQYCERASEVAAAMAAELKSLGINLSWAPLADINTNPENPIVGKLGRAFSAVPQKVAEVCVSFAETLKQHGIIACAKHFPGHGDTWSDSHLELPEVDISEDIILKRELLPFQALINHNIPAIMTAHVLFKNIDPINPATFSKKILTDLLRDKMNFKGVTIADDINMLAIYDKIRTLQGAALSINAGVDCFIVGRFPKPEKDFSPVMLCTLIKDALLKGLLSVERLQGCVQRVDNLLAAAVEYKPHLIDDNLLAKHKKLASCL